MMWNPIHQYYEYFIKDFFEADVGLPSSGSSSTIRGRNVCVYPDHTLFPPLSQPGYPPLLSSGWPSIRRASGGSACAGRSLAAVTMTTTS